MLRAFFAPYLFALSRASWAVQQNLISLGIQLHTIVPPNASPPLITVFDADQGRAIILGSLVLAAAVEACLIALAALTLRRPIFASAIFLLIALPGLLSLCGAPVINPDPKEIIFGSPGRIGDVPGYATLAIMALVGGWSLSILLADLFRLPKERWDLFEHLWIIVGLSTGLFFVVDAAKIQDAADYTQKEQSMHGNSAWLMHQADRYADWCHRTGNDQLTSCIWTENLHAVLLEQSTETLSSFEELSPDSLAMWYGNFRKAASLETEAAIRREIDAYNAATCPATQSHGGYSITKPSEKCEVPPPVFCQYAYKYGGTDDPDRIFRPVALATECVLPTLLTLREEAKPLVASRDENGREKTIKWGPFYLTVAFLAGIKLAGSTLKGLKIEKNRDPDRDWVKEKIIKLLLLFKKNPHQSKKMKQKIFLWGVVIIFALAFALRKRIVSMFS
ncbi:hypothetical protein [Acetobacter sp. DsW_063]|uniref:hypothetical protein n=1 Tax=Acetobacter sp. DsW_063 TaxID=1514894 RepID=UPI000A35E362|nr:hypothetical protein [Acetobacter sp. DsW_063]OUJ14915.1 hypothetical protein HK28_10815 [Acetobacter sp. DsW_063]